MDDQDPRWAQNVPLEAWKKPPMKNKKIEYKHQVFLATWLITLEESFLLSAFIQDNHIEIAP